MQRKKILDRIQKYVRPFRITKGKGFRLKDFDPGETCGLRLDKGEAAELAVEGKRLRHVADVTPPPWSDCSGHGPSTPMNCAGDLITHTFKCEFSPYT